MEQPAKDSEPALVYVRGDIGGSGMIIMSLLAVAQAGAAPQVCTARFTAPIEASWGNDGRSMRLTKDTSFIDQACREWSVPAGATVDGASIPQLLWSVIGGPFEGKYRSSSVIHDWYCDRRDRSWQEVHRVFYDGMIASGVSPALAKTLYMAVYIWGPRWTQQAVLNNALANSKAWVPEKGLDPGLKAAAFARVPPRPSTSASGAHGLMQVMPSVASAASAAAGAAVGTGELPPGVTAQDLVLSQQAQDYAVIQIQTNDNLTLEQIDAMGEQIRFLVPPGVIPEGKTKNPN